MGKDVVVERDQKPVPMIRVHAVPTPCVLPVFKYNMFSRKKLLNNLEVIK